MKSIKYIILAVFTLVMFLGNLTQTLGQGILEFSETFTNGEITSLLDPGDMFFQLINTEQSDPQSSKLGTCHDAGMPGLWEYVHSDLFLKQLPDDIRFAWGASVENGDHPLFALRKPVDATAGPDHKDIQGVAIQKDNKQNTCDLLITFTNEGAGRWAVLTGNNIGKNVAIVIDGKVYAAPKVMMEIKMGKCRISGDFSESEVVQLKELLELSSM